ncbi:MAG: aminopeptidase N [Burkholderiales bacterium]|nr:aminopeptidase N [Burkholderiales bacterium]
MLNPPPRTVHLKDYTPPAFLISAIDLDVDIQEAFTRVRASMRIARNAAAADRHAPLVLDGEDLELESVAIDGRTLERNEYRMDIGQLTLERVPDSFTLETRVRILPALNTRLMGLYASKDGLFTQCEAEGFRRITYFLDRPDVMARYTATIHAERARYPELLSNGNLVSRGDEEDGRHWARWEDPFPKPSYLFALVAGRLDRLEDRFVTASGRTVTLSIYVEPGKLDQCGFAMQALKKSMKWDEEVFGLELDLDHYMIVAVGDFNMGAMENKGLNIFNTKYVLARPDIATDMDFMLIDRVVAHEYFHNWTGNRVTCRDWFQLSLKEGLTVFRDQEFGADTYSRPVQRILEVRQLRAAQFPEDAGPMAHPVRPQSYMEISNFYTPTVYEKGAEVVRMIHTLIGAQAFRKGMDLYFQRHDGQAVTTDDFAQAMQDASGVDLTLFRRWYDQAGTPHLRVRSAYDAARARFTLTLRQRTAPTPGQPEKLPLQLPVVLGLLDESGREIPLRLDGEPGAAGTSRTFSVTDSEATLSFVDVTSRPVPSLLRGFSAPVVLDTDLDDADLAHLMAHDTDAFNRWEAGQRLALNILLRAIAQSPSDQGLDVPPAFIKAFERNLADAARDPAFTAEALSLPSEAYVGEQVEVVDPDAIHEARLQLRRHIAQSLRGELLATYQAYNVAASYSPDAASAGQRALKNQCLSYLMELEDEPVRALCQRQFDGADNMTDAVAALIAIANSDWSERGPALERFYTKWNHEPLVVDKWLAVQASSRVPDTLTQVKRLTQHPAFDLKNPNKVYALIRTFCANQRHFHAADGSGYAFAADQILALDPLNPQIAARLARAFDRWKKFDGTRQAHARVQLTRMRATDTLSKDALEVVSKALA